MAGRKPRRFTKAQIAKIDRWAKAQAKDGTIADALGVDRKVFKRQFTARCRQKRAEGKCEVLEAQYAAASNKAAAQNGSRVWWGKQHLEQTDREKIDLATNVKIDPPVIHLTAPPPAEEPDDAAPTEP